MFDRFNETFNPDNAQCYKRCKQDKSPIGKNLYFYDDLLDEREALIGYVVQAPFVVIDVDDMRDAKLIYTILQKKKYNFWMNKSKRGAHFIFKDTHKRVSQGAHEVCSIGIEVDSRIADKGYIILPVNEPERKWSKQSDEIDEVPFFIIPQKKLKETEDFTKLGNGTGRNDKLFKHYLALSSYSNLTAEEATESINIINQYLFKEPLPKDELETTVLRQAIQEKVAENTVNRVNDKPTRADKLLQISDKIYDQHHIVYTEGLMYKYNKKYYEIFSQNEFHKMVFNQYQANLTDNDRNEILNFMKIRCATDIHNLDREWWVINLRNGRLNLKTMELLPHTATAIDTINVDRKFDPLATTSKRVEDFLSFCSDNDKNKRQVLLEMVGYCLMKTNNFQKAYILFGTGRNGKSTFLQMISNMIGEERTSSVDLQTLLKNDFSAIQLLGKLANIADDISFKNINETDLLKKLISGDRITSNRKFKDHIEFHNYATMIFSTNKLPQTSDRTFGFERRFEVIDFEKRIETPDPTFLEKFTETDYEYLLRLGVEAIHIALLNGKLTTYSKSSYYIKKYMIEGNSLRTFLAEEDIDEETLIGEKVDTLYAKYRMYAIENGFKMSNRHNFTTEMEEVLGIETVYKEDNGIKKMIWSRGE